MDLSQVSTEDLVSALKGFVPKQDMNLDPTAGMSTADKFLAGAGKAVFDTARGVRQLASMAGIGDKNAIQSEIDASRKLDAPLMKTGAGLAGNVVGNTGMMLGTSLIPGANTVAGSALIGAGVGAMQPVATGESRVTNTGLGAVGGAAGSAITKGLSRVISPNVTPEIKTLMDNGITPTPGRMLGPTAQRIEDKLSSFPILGDAINAGRRASVQDLNRAMYRKALDPIGEVAPSSVGREAVADVSQKLSAAYNKILPNITFKLEPQFNAEVGNIRNMIASLPESESSQFDKILQNTVFNRLTSAGLASGESFKSIESDLSRIARGYLGDPSFDKRQLGSAVQSVLDSMRSSLERTNPALAPELAKVNQGYRAYAVIRNAAARQGSSEGVFTPAQLSAAVRSMDKSVGKGNFARGTAFLQDVSDPAKSVLGSQYPDSGTAGRLLLDAAIGGGAYHFLGPQVPVGLGLASLPYLPGGRQLVAGLLSQRPAIASPIGRAIAGTIPQGGLLGASYAVKQ